MIRKANPNTAPDYFRNETIPIGAAVEKDICESVIRTIPLSDLTLAAGFGAFIQDVTRHRHRRLSPYLSVGVNRKTVETNACYAVSVMRDFGA